MRLFRQFFKSCDRVGDDRIDRLAVVDDAVDERGVGAVFEQPPHQIGEQFLVAADRRIDPARPVQMFGTDDFVVQRLAHAVQPLELPIMARAGEFDHRRGGMCIVGGELRVKERPRGEEPAGAGEVGDVGRELAGIDRIAVEPLLLARLDFAVPIGAFDETQHQPPPAAPREVGEPVDQGQRALLISLDRETETVPLRELGHERQPLDQIERQVETVRLLGVDGKADAGFLGAAGKMQQQRRHFGA